MEPRIGSPFSVPVGRRAAVGMMLGLGAAVLVGRSAHAAQATGGQGIYTTTAAANYRSGPGLTYDAVDVLPAGTTVQASGRVENGYRQVWHLSYIGWVYGSLLVPADTAGADPLVVGLGTTTASANLRSGPSAGNQVLRVLAAGALFERSDTVRNGYRYVVHQGLAGWIFDAYVRPTTDGPGGEPIDPTGVARTTAAVNFRAQPSTSARVIAVIPAGTQVSLQDGVADGFREVGYNGTYGWVATSYLN